MDANGNYRNIGTTTTDSDGVYLFDWVPDISGKYTVYVTFAGSDAYYASLAGSAFVVDQPVATATPTQGTQDHRCLNKSFYPQLQVYL